MSEAQLNILNYALLALIYLFFARVLWAVWSEVRGPRVGQPTPRQQAGTAAGRGGPAPDPTAVAARASRLKRSTTMGCVANSAFRHLSATRLPINSCCAS